MFQITLLTIAAVLVTAAPPGVDGSKKMKICKKSFKAKSKCKGKAKGHGGRVQYHFTPAPPAPVSHPYIIHVPQPFPVPHPFEVVKHVFVPFKVVEKVPYEVVRHVPYETIKYVPIDLDKGYDTPSYKVIGDPSYGSSTYHSSPSLSLDSYSSPTYSSSPYRRMSDTARSSSLSARSIIREGSSHYRYSPLYVSSAQADTSQHYGINMNSDYGNEASAFDGARSIPFGRQSYAGEFRYFE